MKIYNLDCAKSHELAVAFIVIETVSKIFVKILKTKVRQFKKTRSKMLTLFAQLAGVYCANIIHPSKERFHFFQVVEQNFSDGLTCCAKQLFHSYAFILVFIQKFE